MCFGNDRGEVHMAFIMSSILIKVRNDARDTPVLLTKRNAFIWYSMLSIASVCLSVMFYIHYEIYH